MTTLTMRYIKGDFLVTGPDIEPVKFVTRHSPCSGGGFGPAHAPGRAPGWHSQGPEETMWKVENVKLVKNGHGFHITNFDGKPVVLFAYESQAEAKAA